jgi:formylglycine-generating enzyme required for sulfatase activity
MDDLGFGIGWDGDESGDVNIINNTIVNNASCPLMASLRRDSSFQILNNYNALTTIGNDYTKLSPYYMANTETTAGQFSCFLNAIEPDISNPNVRINSTDLAAILSKYAPLSGHTDTTVQAVLSIGKAVNTTASSWTLCSYTTSATSPYGQVYYSTASKIFAPNDAQTVQAGESVHNNKYAQAFISWYGGMSYSIWMGGMLPTAGQWYYAGCATDNGGGMVSDGITNISKLSHWPSPSVSPASVPTSNVVDAELSKIAWYAQTSGSHTHEVAKLAPNQVGLYDMSGNVWEWCLDWYIGTGTTNYTGGADGVSAPSGATTRAQRGGDWHHGPRYCSLGVRGDDTPENLHYIIGFRLAIVP